MMSKIPELCSIPEAAPVIFSSSEITPTMRNFPFLNPVLTNLSPSLAPMLATVSFSPPSSVATAPLFAGGNKKEIICKKRKKDLVPNYSDINISDCY